MMDDKAPIVALATPPGRGGVGVVRVSGPKEPVTRLIEKYFEGQAPLKPRYAHLRKFSDEQGELIDEGLALYFPAPRSYTGETVFELQAHGGPVVLNMLVKSLLAYGKEFGLRLAQPGEFTKRAFLNDKIDLSQAESIADIIDADSESAVRAASRSLTGVFSGKIHALTDELINLRAHIEAILDFPEEEVDFLAQSHAKERLLDLRGKLISVLNSTRQGSILREGVTVVLAGSPNVGKSSLMNALSGEEVAIVTDVAGTTRDKIENLVHIGGVPVRLIDTAGLHETDDKVEKIGIQKTLDAIAGADVVVHITGALKKISADNSEDAEILSQVIDINRKNVPILEVVNKCDLVRPENTKGVYAISALTGEGMDVFKEALLEAVGWKGTTESLFLARQRHIEALKSALSHVEEALRILGCDKPMLDLLAEELKLSANDLGDVVGQTPTEDLLGMIFSRFCIGK